MQGWGNNQNNGPTIDFQQLLQESKSVVKLLETQNIIDEVKNHSANFTTQILRQQHRPLLLQLIEVAINPKHHMETHSTDIDHTLTHAAIQILNTLTQDFIEEVFDQPAQQEDQVVQADPQYPIFNHLIAIATVGGMEQTGWAYFLKVVAPFIYQRAQQVLKLFASSACQALLPFYSSKALSDLFNKLLEAETQKQFFETEKIQIVGTISQHMQSIIKEDSFASHLDSFSELVETMLEKHEDKYDQAKYIPLIKELMGKTQYFIFLVEGISAQPSPSVQQLLFKTIEVYLRIFLPVKQEKVGWQEPTDYPPPPLDLAFLAALKTFLKEHPVSEFVNDNRMTLLSYYKTVKTLLNVDDTATSQVLSKEFIVETLQIMKKDSSNNILHNHQREIIVKALEQSEEVYDLLQQEPTLQSTLRELSEKNSRESYETQYFLIGQALKKKTTDGSVLSEQWSDIEKALTKKREFFSVIIGGNPGADQWSFGGSDLMMPGPSKQENKQSNGIPSALEKLGGHEVVSDEESEEEEFNNNRAGEENGTHFFNYDLPLDSDKEEEVESPIQQSPVVVVVEESPVQVIMGGFANASKMAMEQMQKDEAISPEMGRKEGVPVMTSSGTHLSTEHLPIDSNKSIEAKPKTVTPAREQTQVLLLAKYGLYLNEKDIPKPGREEFSTLLRVKYGLQI